MWSFRGANFQYVITLNPGRVDPLWRVRAVCDVNHDGRSDLVWQYAPSGQVAFWLMDGITAIGFVVPQRPMPRPDWEIFGCGDVNFDGQSDLSFGSTAHRGTLAVWHMMGTEYVRGLSPSASPNDAAWRAVAVLDLDGDAAPDIVLATLGYRDDIRVGFRAGDPPLFASFRPIESRGSELEDCGTEVRCDQ